MTGRRRQGTGRITLDDVARVAEVSPITVSRALRSPEKVSAATRERVERAAAKVGYVPNRLAGALASNASRVVGFVAATLNNSIFGETIQAFIDVLDDAGFQLLVGASGYQAEREEALIREFLSHRVAGLALVGTTHTAGARRMLAAAGVPVVELWELADRPIDMVVGFDNRGAARAVTERLIERGCRRLVAAVSLIGDERRSETRLAGFRDAAAETGVAIAGEIRIEQPLLINESGARILDYIRSLDGVDGVFCTNEFMATGTLVRCQAAGIRVPDDIAIVGMGDTQIASVVPPGLTTIRFPDYEIGHTAAETLIERMAGRDFDTPSVRLDWNLVLRGTA
ncbi:MAG: LacI family DNA-binding transcriptional regulator [Azospirillaceae bacterium]